MASTYLTTAELTETANRQLYLLERELAKNGASLSGIGNLMPGSLLVHDMATLQVLYVNEWGCEGLRYSLEEIKGMGPTFFEKFFVPEETARIISDVMAYFENKGNSSLYGFFQQVRLGPKKELNWHYTSCKFLRNEADNSSPQLILASNPVAGMGLMVKKVNKLLDENVYVAKNYKRFMLLTKREKEIIALLAEGKTTNTISEILFISHYTVSTHRKNISNKLSLNSFSELLKFAVAFELVK